MTASIHYISASYLKARSICQTFVGPVHVHILNLVELAIEGGIKLLIGWKQTMCSVVDELVPERLQESLLRLGLLFASHYLAQNALSLADALSPGHVAYDARIVVGLIHT